MSRSEVVVLAGGFALPREALLTALDLEQRGITLELGEGDTLFARPRSLLTDADRTALARWRQYIRAFISYQPPTPSWQ